MRILHVDGGHDWAGGQNQVRLLMRELARVGVTQLCCCPAGSSLAKRLRAEHLPYVEVPWSRGMDPRAVFALMRLTRKFDVVHCHDAHALQIAWLPARMYRRKLVASRRTHFKTSALKWNRADAVIAISGVVERVLIESGVDAGRIARIYSGVDIDEVRRLPPLESRVRDRIGVTAREFLAGSIGKLSEYKGQTVIPPAARAAPEIHWAVIGEGPLRHELETSIQSLGVGSRVHLLGRIDDARRALREFDVFVFPSPNEPLGSSLFDAMAVGVPIVAARAAGAEEILAPVHARTHSTLYEPGQAHELARLIVSLHDDGAQRRKMVIEQNLRLEDFTIQNTAQRTLALYKSL